MSLTHALHRESPTQIPTQSSSPQATHARPPPCVVGSAHPMASCKPTLQRTRTCDDPTGSLYARAYALAPRWPFLNLPIYLIMEAEPSSCDFYRSSGPCCDWTRKPEGMVEHSVREALVALLGRCALKNAAPCRAVDFGANNGWMSLFMLALGANVTSVEPASDFADAIGESARLNCWGERHRALNAFACERDDRGNKRGCMRHRRAWNGYRAGGGGREGLRDKLRETPGMTIAEILTGTAADGELPSPAKPTRIHYDLLKLDGDGPEGTWMRAIDRLMSARRISVSSILLEGNNLDEATMVRFQSRHGFHIYRLDEADHRRHMTPDGWDDFSPKGSILNLTRSSSSGVGRVWARDALEEEIFGVRGMRHLWRVKDNLSKIEWNILLSPIGPYDAKHSANKMVSAGGQGYQWMLVKEQLSEPVLPVNWRAHKWRAMRGLA